MVTKVLSEIRIVVQKKYYFTALIFFFFQYNEHFHLQAWIFSPVKEKGDQENLNLELILLTHFMEINFVMTFESVSLVPFYLGFMLPF